MLRTKHVGVLAAILVFTWGCGNGGTGTGTEPPCSSTGTADDALFAQHFIRMALVDRATGLPGSPDPELGERYTPTAFLELRMDAKAAVSVRACVEAGMEARS